MVDIVEQLEQLLLSRQDMVVVQKAIDEIESLRSVLQKIADLEHEDLPAPLSPNEAVLWVCLERCITMSENVLKRNKDDKTIIKPDPKAQTR